MVTLSSKEVMLLSLAAFAAGLIRGFAGFGLSAVVMASAATFVPPVSLIPVCFLLEAMASMVMFRGGLKDADMRIVWGLAIGSIVGSPVGFYATTSIDPDTSKVVALTLVTSLSILQLLKFRSKFLATNSGLYVSGLLAGVATGLASIGGMVVALYVLSTDAEPKRMRASLVMFLFVGMFSSTVYLLSYQMLTPTALYRALLFAPPLFLGLLMGTTLFRPNLQHLYKRVCLAFLIGLCLIGLGRQLL